MIYPTAAIVALLSVLGSTTALPEPQPQTLNNASLEARKTVIPNFIYNQNPPKGRCRFSSYISKINHDIGWRVIASDGSFITSGGCGASLCTTPLLGLGDDLAILRLNNAEWKFEYMRSGTVSDDRWLSTDTSRCTMFPEKPMGDQSVTVTCDFDCHQKYAWPLEGINKASSIIMKAETTDAEVAADLVLPSGLAAPPS